MQKTKPFNFEQKISKLESLVEMLENQELPLEDALKHFEAGVTLTRECQQALQEAEQKVKILMQKNDQDELVNFIEDKQDED